MDSLNRALNLTMDKGQRIKNLNLIAFELRQKDPMKAGMMAEEALELARRDDEQEWHRIRPDHKRVSS